MDPLSSLRFAVSPEVRAIRAPIGGESFAGRVIPTAELERLPKAFEVNAEAKSASGSSFENTLGRLVADVNGRQIAANDAVAGVLSGQNTSLHQTMIAVEEASVSFQLMVEVRNKLLESYNELMRMQV